MCCDNNLWQTLCCCCCNICCEDCYDDYIEDCCSNCGKALETIYSKFHTVYIAGNIGGKLNFVDWRFYEHTAKFKSAKLFFEYYCDIIV